MAQLSMETVKQAIDILKSQGKKLTNRNIVAYLGYGSFSTLKKIRECHPELFSAVDTQTISISDTDEINSALEKRVSFLETSLQVIQQSIQQLIQDKVISSTNLKLQKQVEELTENLQEMYQLWQEATQQLMSEFNCEKAIITDVTTENFDELPNPQQTPSFVSWAQQQKEQHNGSWKPVVEWLNQHHITTPKGQLWTPKSLSDFIRKRKLQSSRVKLPT